MPTPPNVAIDTSSSSSVLVPTPQGNYATICVLSYNITADAPTDVRLEDDLGNVFDGEHITPAGSGLVKPPIPNGYNFQLGKGRSLVLVNSGSAHLLGSLQFMTPMAGY